MFKELNVMKIFFDEPRREFSVREAAKLLKLAPATASKELFALAEQGLLKCRDERLAKLYSANIDSDTYRDLKKYYTLRKLKESGLIEAINRFYSMPAIIFFGSAAKGSDTETSDLDLFIMSEKKDLLPEKEEFERLLRKKLQIFTAKQLSEVKNESLLRNILNGDVVQGEVQWR